MTKTGRKKNTFLCIIYLRGIHLYGFVDGSRTVKDFGTLNFFLGIEVITNPIGVIFFSEEVYPQYSEMHKHDEGQTYLHSHGNLSSSVSI